MKRRPQPSIANRIRERRLAKGLTAIELAEMVGTSAQQIYRLELGERRLAHLWIVKIAAALGCSPADLLAPADAVQLPLSSAVIEDLERLIPTGLYGATVNEVARTLVLDGLKRIMMPRIGEALRGD